LGHGAGGLAGADFFDDLLLRELGATEVTSGLGA
jgi:hypothetical protein